MLSRYGPEGVRLMVAGCADALSGAPIIIVGGVMRAVVQHQLVTAVVSVFLLAAGLGAIVLALIRLFQASRAAKRFREQSPFKE
jgi:hypothetical protein